MWLVNYLNGWNKQRSHTQKSHPKWWTPEIQLRNAEEEEEEEGEEEEEEGEHSLEHNKLKWTKAKKHNRLFWDKWFCL